MKAIFILLLAAAASSAYAQNAGKKYTVPDLDMIKKEIKDAKSAHYYPFLLARYQDNDTSLSVEDYRYLYYGYSYQTDYNSLPIPSGSMDSIRKIRSKDSLTIADYARLEGFIKDELKGDPFSPKFLDMLTTVYRKTGQQDLYRKLRYKSNTVIDAILSTGDGMSSSSGWYVTNIGHEYDLLWVLDFQFGGEQRLISEGPCDYLTVKENKYKIEGFYFNVKISMGELDDMRRKGGSKPKTSKSKKQKKGKDVVLGSMTSH